MSAGDTLLDADGNVILDDDGNKKLSDGSGDGCCCSLECFQKWQATYDCDTNEWTVVSIDKECLPAGTSTAWTGAACVWTRYVDMGHSCSSDGDCEGYDDTTPPAPPFDGGTPPSCCPPPVDCGDCTFSPSFLPTPRVWTVSFDSVGTTLVRCTGDCIFGGITSDGAPLDTYELEQDPDEPCRWFVLTTGPRVNVYRDDETCSAAPTFSSDSLLVELILHPGSGIYQVIASNPDVEAYFASIGLPITIQYFDGDNDPLDPPTCCTAKTFDNRRTYSCSEPGDGGSAIGTPHC